MQNNFRIKYQLTAGQTYYFGASYFSNNTGTIPVMLELIHNWGAYEQMTPPTCTQAGLETSTCSICSETTTRPIPATGHTLSDPVSNDNGTHTGHCFVCNQDVTEPCTYTDTNQPGIVKHTCTVCGYSYAEAIVGDQSLAFWSFEDGTTGWTFIDRDGDDKNWGRSYGNAYEGNYKISSAYNSTVSVDHWAISPAVSLVGASSSTLSVRAKRENSSYEETFALYAGTSADPDAMRAISNDFSAAD